LIPRFLTQLATHFRRTLMLDVQNLPTSSARKSTVFVRPGRFGKLDLRFLTQGFRTLKILKTR